MTIRHIGVILAVALCFVALVGTAPVSAQPTSKLPVLPSETIGLDAASAASSVTAAVARELGRIAAAYGNQSPRTRRKGMSERVTRVWTCTLIGTVAGSLLGAADNGSKAIIDTAVLAPIAGAVIGAVVGIILAIAI